MTEKETGNAQLGACVDVLPRVHGTRLPSRKRETGPNYILHITMLTRSRAFFIASILRTIRPVLFSKTGNTLESSVEVVKPPLEDMGDGKTKTATFAMS